MHISRKMIGLILAGAVLTGCTKSAVPTDTTQESSMPEEVQQNDESMAKPVTIQLSALKNSGQTGTALFEDLGDGKTKVSLSLSGGTFTQAQPAHIHMGSCTNPGAVKYPLTDVVNGMSETTIDAPMSSLWNGDLLVNVHKSTKEAGVYTSCGDMTTEASMMNEQATPDAMMGK